MKVLAGVKVGLAVSQRSQCGKFSHSGEMSEESLSGGDTWLGAQIDKALRAFKSSVSCVSGTQLLSSFHRSRLSPFLEFR